MPTTLDAPAAVTAHEPRRALRAVYLARSVFAVGWALLLVLAVRGGGAADGASLGPLVVALLVLYPVVDVLAAVVDRRTSRASTPPPALLVNITLSALGAVGLAVAATSGSRAVLVVWGVWAVVAGAVQVVVAVPRRALGGQWPMILSGGLSVLAGASFVVQSGAPTASLVGLAGYATLGGIFFLVSASRLHRAARAR